jgi:hypothetical protein
MELIVFHGGIAELLVDCKRDPVNPFVPTERERAGPLIRLSSKQAIVPLAAELVGTVLFLTTTAGLGNACL